MSMSILGALFLIYSVVTSAAVLIWYFWYISKGRVLMENVDMIETGQQVFSGFLMRGVLEMPRQRTGSTQGEYEEEDSSSEQDC